MKIRILQKGGSNDIIFTTYISCESEDKGESVLKNHELFKKIESKTGINQALVKKIIEEYQGIIIDELIEKHESNICDYMKLKINPIKPKEVKGFDGNTIKVDWSFNSSVNINKKLRVIIQSKIQEQKRKELEESQEEIQK